MSNKPTVAIDSIMDIAPYKQGGAVVRGVENVIKLSSNENPFGPSPNVLKAIEEATKEIHLYADGSCADLREAIAKRHDIDSELIVCGAGSDELIALLCQAYAGKGDEVLYSRYGFLMYPISSLRAGALPVVADEMAMKVDVDKMLAEVTPRTKIVFLANPNNPTGSYLTRAEMLRLRQGLADNILLVIDAAYAEYVTEDDYTSGLALVKEYDNIVMLRTYSKIYGMGGLRLGWSYAPKDIVDVLNRVRGPFNVSNIAMKAGIAAIEDVDYVQKCVEHTVTWRKKVSTGLQALGLKVYPSVANFVLVEFSTDKNAADADTYLKSKGIIARSMVAYGLPDCMRFSIGKENENLALVDALTDYIEGK